MLFVMQNGGNFVEKATPPNDIVYLVCSLKSLISRNVLFYFSDGHATDKYTTSYDVTMIAHLPAIIDWQAVRASFWGGLENLTLKRKKQSELLVAQDVEPEHIVGFVCYDGSSKNRLATLGCDVNKIEIKPSAYY